MATKESAEQKLLKIIEATKKAQAAASGDGPVIVPKKTSPFLLNGRQINMLLLLLALASFVYFGVEARAGYALLASDVRPAVPPVLSPSGAVPVIPRPKGMSYYFGKVLEKNIFQPYEVKSPEAVSAGPAALAQRMERYKMVGIAWLDLPESATVMIEDVSSHEVFFLREGDSFGEGNALSVKIIYTDRVVFAHANEEITIKL